MLVHVNVANSWLTDTSSVLNCKISHLPFLYLGLPIVGDSRKLSFWQPIFKAPDVQIRQVYQIVYQVIK